MSFIAWYQAPDGASLTAWEAFSITDIAIALTALSAVGFGLASLARFSVSLPIAGSSMTAGFAALALVLLIFRLLDPPDEFNRELGIWLGLLATAAIAFGGYFGMQEHPSRMRGQGP